jgi:hypothetical protein
MMETYEDFNLRIVADGTGYRVLAQSSAGEASNAFESPAGGNALSSSSALQDRQRADLRDLDPQQATTQPALETIGDQLFQALLNGPVRRLFDRSLAADPERNVRVRIHIDPRDERLRPLAGLPWELLYCADTCEFLNLNRRTPVVRSLDALQRTVPVALTPPLRVLLVMANPEGTSKLELTEERSRVENALRSVGSVEPKVLEHATAKGLQRCLAAESFQIVHFMGHGSFEDDNAEGFVLLETADGGRDPVSGEVLATLLKQESGPVLVILNACKTARSCERGDAPPFSGVAAALVGKGIPAVLAMRTVIGDRAAITLTEEIYERLAAGDPIEAAVSEARLALYAGPQAPPDWAIPALFVRSAAFDLQSETHDKVGSAEVKPATVPATSGPTVNNLGPVTGQFIATHQRNRNTF